MSNLPRPPVRVFVGRNTALGQLGEALSGRAGAVAVYGLGGVGKSELALQHAHAHRGDYQLAWWLTAGDAVQVEAGLAALAARLCPEIGMVGTTQDAAGWAMAWLQAHTRWLLVLDNVEDPRDAEPLLAQLFSGHILLTTRRDVEWQRLAVPVRLDVLDPGPAAEIISKRTGHATIADQDDAAAIATQLGHLPLALDQAAAYITQTRLTPGTYLARLRYNPAHTYAAAGVGAAQQTIARLWDITIDSIRERDTDAIRLLRVLACYAPDNIPRLIIGGADPSAGVDDSLGLLASYSMITLTSETVSIHRLVQAVTLSKQEADQKEPTPAAESPRDTALNWLDQAIPADPDNNLNMWPLLRTLVPHTENLTRHYPAPDQPEQLGRMHNQIGLFNYSQGDYALAHLVFESAVRIFETTLGPNHLGTASALANLASTYRALGRAADALPVAQRALQITETALGSEAADVGVRLGNLASTYRDLGRPADALPLEQRALRITEMALGSEAADVGVRLSNLAFTYNDLGRPTDALPLEQRALRITETALGPDHPEVAARLGNLSATYNDLGRPTDALPLEQRALQITETALGPDHPVVANRLGQLAITYSDLRRPADALPLEQRALQITETALGPDHPVVAIRLGNLAYTYRDLRRPADALPLEKRALQIKKRETPTGSGPG